MSTRTRADAPVPSAPSAANGKRQQGILRRLRSNYTFNVLMQGLVTIWAVTTFTFFLIRLMPGNPVQVKIDQLMNTQNVTYEQALAIAAGLFEFDPNEPVIQQYVNYLGKLLTGDLGVSITSAGTPVLDQILRFLPWTLFCVGLSLVISFTFGIILGLLMAFNRGSFLDNVLTGFASVTAGLPDYIVALLILLIFGVQLQWFQVGEFRGGVNPNIAPGFTLDYIGSVLKHAFLPVLVYVLGSIGSWMLAMKSSTISTLGEDYITVAQARGLSERRVLTAYVGRNAMLPLLTRLAISVGFVVSGAVVIEEFFQYPGLGRALYRAIASRDYTTMQGVFLVVTSAVVLANIASDLVLGWLDPRVRVGKGGEK